MPHFKTDQINSSAHPPSFSAPHHESHPPGADSQSKMVNVDYGLHNYHAQSVRHNLHSSNGTGAGRCYKIRYRFQESRHILCGAAFFSENSGRCAGRCNPDHFFSQKKPLFFWLTPHFGKILPHLLIEVNKADDAGFCRTFKACCHMFKAF